jgi:hypothetical protein
MLFAHKDEFNLARDDVLRRLHKTPPLVIFLVDWLVGLSVVWVSVSLFVCFKLLLSVSLCTRHAEKFFFFCSRVAATLTHA